MTPTSEQLSRYLTIAEQALDSPDWTKWCRNVLEDTLRQAQAFDALGRDVRDALLGRDR